MLGKIIGFLFCGMFAAAGIGIFISQSIPMITSYSDARSWEPINAQLLEHNLKTNRSDDGTTYTATARYTYEYRGDSYTSNKVGFSQGSDNIGSYHQDINTRLYNIKRNGQPLTVWVNPNNPNESVIDRSLRWGMLLFSSLFLFLFGGIGVGGMVLLYKFRNAGEKTANTDTSQPWLDYSEWSNKPRKSSAQAGSRVLLVFALIWNLISFSSLIGVYNALQDGDYAVLIILLFPAVGIFLFYLWYKANRSYKSTGPILLSLDPYPGSIGGEMGGVLRFAKRLPHAPKNLEVTLKCVYQYNSGKKTRYESVWETSMVPQLENGLDGQEVRFCFDVPEDVPLSDPPLQMPGHQWEVHLSGTVFNGNSGGGIELERTYDDIPMFVTGQQSSIRDRAAHADTSMVTQSVIDDLVESALDVKSDVRGHVLHYAAFRNAWALMFFVVGMVFFTIGFFIPSLIFNTIFPILGGSFALLAAYSYANSLDVLIRADGIRSQRVIFGYKCKEKFLPSYSFSEFKAKKSHSTTSGSNTTQYFSIVAHGKAGEKLTVAEDLKGKREADAAIQKLNSLI